ncbi:MAG: hypothetical protein WEA09_08815 [Gemmatimonadota bacterium]
MLPVTHPKSILILGFTIAVAACSPEEPSPGNAGDEGLAAAGQLGPPGPAAVTDPADYEIVVTPEILPDAMVRLNMTTNIPGVIEVMAGLSLQGQAPDDVWIGKSERVRLTAGTGEVMLSTEDLPTGRYDAEVSFYPRWGPQDERSRESGITHELRATAPLDLVGSGEAASDAQFKLDSQRWVMENVGMGDPWVPNDWTQRFGAYEELMVDRGNPDILKAYYFPRLDMTLIVNILRDEISIWREGRAHR